MTQTNLLELAKQGDPQAIAILMNRSLQPRGMTADVELQGNCLRVALEAEQVPNRQALTAFVQNGIGNLGIKSIQSIKVVGRQIGATIPAWVHEIVLDVSADEAASNPALTGNRSAAGADLLAAAPPLPRPTPPPISPIQPGMPPVPDTAAALPADQLSRATDAAAEPENTAGNTAGATDDHFESLGLEDLGLDDLEFKEFDEEAIAPLSNADFGFPEDSELEEAIANDFGVSEVMSRDGLTDNSAFTNSLDDLRLGALDDEPGSTESQEAINNQFGQFEQFGQDATILDSLEDFDFGDELSETELDLEHSQTDADQINTADLLASLDFEDGLELEGFDLTNELDLTSELGSLPPVSGQTPESGSAIDFEHDLSFADDLLTESDIPTDPLSELAFDEVFNEDDFNLSSELNTAEVSEPALDLPDNFDTEPDEVSLDALEDFDLENELGFEPIDQLTADVATDSLPALGLEDEFQFESNRSEAESSDVRLDNDDWSLDAEPTSDSWLTEAINSELPNLETAEPLVTELPTTDIPTDASAPLAFTDEFNWAEELSPHPLAEGPAPAFTDASNDKSTVGLELEDDFTFTTDLPLSVSDQPSAANVPDLETSSFLELNNRQPESGQDDLGTVELVDSPDDDLPPELLVDDIATPGLYSPYDAENYSANDSDEDMDTDEEEVVLDWMTEPLAEPLLDAFSEDREILNTDETWGQPTGLEPPLEGFVAAAPTDFYLDTDPPGSALEPDEEERTIDLTDSGYSSDQPLQFVPELFPEPVPEPDSQSLAVEQTVPLQPSNRAEETSDSFIEQEFVEQEFVGQEETGEEFLWADVQTEPETIPAPGYFPSDEARGLDHPRLIEEADPLALSLEPTTDQNFDWDADAVLEPTPEVSPRSDSTFNSLTSSVLLFLIGWVALLIGYSLWTNLTAPSPPIGEPQQLNSPPANPPSSPGLPANQGTPPAAP